MSTERSEMVADTEAEAAAARLAAIDELEAQINSGFGTDMIHRLVAEAVVDSKWLAEREEAARERQWAEDVRAIEEAGRVRREEFVASAGRVRRARAR